MTTRRWRRGIGIGMFLVGLAGCGGAATSQSSVAPAQVAPGGTAGGEGGGGEGVEAALVTFADATQGFTIGYPGTWTQDRAVTAGVQFAGGDDTLTLQFVTPPVGMTLRQVAVQDSATLATQFTQGTEVGLNPSPEVANAIVLGFTAQATSTVTGKSYPARGDRYFMPLADGRIAVLTVVGPANHYDREGVRDIALTFKSTH